jgi:hypothetical protein
MSGLQKVTSTMTNNAEHPNTPDHLLKLVERAATHRLNRRELLTIACAIGAGTLVASQLGPLRRALGISSGSPAPGFGGVPTGSSAGGGNLITIWLEGGIDGLSVLVPFNDGKYFDNRKTLRLMPHEILSLGPTAEQGLHPAFRNVQRRYLDGSVAFIRGIGYGSGDLSHFESAAHWEHGYGQPGSTDTTVKDGWLGRWANSIAPDPYRLITFRPTDYSVLGSAIDPLNINPFGPGVTGLTSATKQKHRPSEQSHNCLAAPAWAPWPTPSADR